MLIRKENFESVGAELQHFTQSAYLTCQELNFRLDSGLAPHTAATGTIQCSVFTWGSLMVKSQHCETQQRGHLPISAVPIWHHLQWPQGRWMIWVYFVTERLLRADVQLGDSNLIVHLYSDDLLRCTNWLTRWKQCNYVSAMICVGYLNWQSNRVF